MFAGDEEHLGGGGPAPTRWAATSPHRRRDRAPELPGGVVEVGGAPTAFLEPFDRVPRQVDPGQQLPAPQGHQGVQVGRIARREGNAVGRDPAGRPVRVAHQGEHQGVRDQEEEPGPAPSARQLGRELVGDLTQLVDHPPQGRLRRAVVGEPAPPGVGPGAGVGYHHGPLVVVLRRHPSFPTGLTPVDDTSITAIRRRRTGEAGASRLGPACGAVAGTPAAGTTLGARSRTGCHGRWSGKARTTGPLHAELTNPSGRPGRPAPAGVGESPTARRHPTGDPLPAERSAIRPSGARQSAPPLRTANGTTPPPLLGRPPLPAPRERHAENTWSTLFPPPPSPIPEIGGDD